MVTTHASRPTRVRGGRNQAGSAPDLNGPLVLAHPSLREYLCSRNPLWGNPVATGIKVEFVDYEGLNTRDDLDGASIMLPVNTEYQAQNLQTVRARHAMELIVAVTNDVTGHSTYFAIRAGANFVINLAISGEQQAEIFRARLREHARSTRPASVDTVPRGGGSEVRHMSVRRGAGAHPAPLDESDQRLLHMLRSPMTVAEIARRNYMSERSMYRRIRHLYDALGVVGRAELVECTDQGAGRSPVALYA